MRTSTDVGQHNEIQNHYREIEVANDLLRNVCIRTDIRQLAWLFRIAGVDAVGKFENQQITGSFKFRGAYNRLSHQKEGKPIIAASAGNHALAVAEAAKRLKIPTTLCVPTNASQLKRNRLSAYSHSIVPHGASLEEATAYAMELARRQGWDFVSPYNDPKIIQGQGTLGIEFLEQVPDLDTIIIPVGGGGLISGVGIAAKTIKPGIKVIGVEPETYASVGKSLEQGTVTRVVNYPTFADGLAVNLEENSVTLDLIRSVVDKVISVSEEELAAAVLALLFHESQMIEASGAAGLAAILAGKVDSKQYGKIGLVFSGGNITTANLSRIMHYPFRNKALVPFLNVYGERLQDAAVTRGVDYGERVKGDEQMSTEQSTDIKEDIKYIEGRFDHVRQVMSDIRKKLAEYLSYCELEGLQTDESATDTFKSLDEVARKMSGEERIDLSEQMTPSEYNRKVTEYIQKYRALLHIVMGASMVLDWRSASYGQSWDTMFFNLDAQGNPGVNYNRYESNQLKNVETQMAEVLGIDQRETGLLMTSSGMAAYTMIESYLTRYILEPGDTVLIPQYIYFETDEQISKLRGINIQRDDTHDNEEILRLISERKPRVVYLDPLTNTQELQMTDVDGIIAEVAKMELDEDIYFVIDGSLMSGELDPFTPAKTNPHVKILYYDSCSKYLQLGLDIAMGGLVAIPVELTKTFDRLRRNTGTIMYDSAANIFPKYDRETHKKRMRRFARNSLLVGDVIENDQELEGQVSVSYPMRESHPDHELARRFNSTGGLMTFEFKDEALKQRDSLNSFIETALRVAKEMEVSLTKGVSFGFSLPRISAAAAMAENSPPFLRLSVGDRSYNETKLLADALRKAFKEYIQAHKQLT